MSKFQFLRACDTHVAAGDLAHNGAVPAMNKNATTWRIDFFLDTQGELSYSPSQKKELLITSYSPSQKKELLITFKYVPLPVPLP